MKKFLLKILVWLVPVIALHLFLGSFAGGNTDTFYRRFTSPKQSNLILGNSRAAQGIQPTYLKSLNGENFYNFSFTIFDSPYGETYLKAVQEKIKPDTKAGNFIITLDPWSVSNHKNDLHSEPEKKGMLGKLHFFNLNPNYDYLLTNYHKSWFNIYSTRDSKYKGKMYLNNDGWLELSITFNSEKEYQKNVEEKLSSYRSYAKEYGVSQNRISRLNEMIAFLKDHGKVILVRLPQSTAMHQIEERYSPEFNSLMQQIATSNGVKFIDFSDSGGAFNYLDGNHLQKDSGREFTKMLNDSLQTYFKP
ncbi:MAG TPA: hypothetical protein PKI04_10920 [Kaistella sp.]|nr:hypothetical protein [Kaistella sp.]